jgi:hypothetical protein
MHGSRPDEIRIHGLEPIAARAALIETALSLRHNAFEPKLTGLRRPAATAPDLHLPLALLAGKNPETVMLDFVQPTGSGGRAIDQYGLAWADEADCRISSPTGRGGAPGYGFQVERSCVAGIAPGGRRTRSLEPL